MNTAESLSSPLAACIARSVKPFIAHASGSFVLGCALHTLYSAFVDVQAAPSLRLEVATLIAAFCTKVWLVQLVVDSANYQTAAMDWATVSAPAPMLTDAALAASSHILAQRLGAHHLLCSPTADLRYLLGAFAVYLGVGACILFGRTGVHVQLQFRLHRD